MTIEYEEDVMGKNYQDLIEFVSKKSDKFALVIRKDMLESEKWIKRFYNKTLKEIQSSLIEMKEQSEWSVNKLLEATAYVYYYELNEQTIRFLKTKSDSLFGWEFKLPEDLTFYSGNKVLLAVNSHEGYFFVDEELENDEDFMNLLI